ncbi:hypothetical protein HME9302_01967 [Alteripontixanthobacter maritimus]|uniref:Uncharacterized protein n=1 Tax=Alteripontixanthobacter maritimus TaxID=2161824 RepID=A0A369Q7A6_9SPHN|nr:hypothetical protein [Alteripontixanthobacter maritimus]RDC60751.1 hypothetical protein HME9302_01967 [Alteripontixanthobacter maritimus]
MGFGNYLIFTSEAERVGLVGLVCIGLAILAMLAERRRMKVARLDRIGWMPWTGLFLVLVVIGATMVIFGVQGLLTPE